MYNQFNNEANTGGQVQTGGGGDEHTRHCQRLHTMGCYDKQLITHSVMIGPKDPRLPRSGQLEQRTEDDRE